jgi:VCBS repeat protein
VAPASAFQRSSDSLVAIQLYRGVTRVGGGDLGNSPFDAGWQVAASGDFNGDGRPDLVYRRGSDGLTEIQFLNGITSLGGGPIADNPFDNDWQIAASGDFNGDGKSDLVWRRGSDGLTEIQFLNDTAAVGGGILANNPFDSSWNVVGAGDFNRDGHTDLVWRRGSDGLTEVQFVKGMTAVGGGPIANNPFDSSWNVVAVGDFLGDGHADLVWQRASDGVVEIQYLNGSVATGGGQIQNNPFDASWRVVGAADFNSDGKADLVYRRAVDGVTEVQFLSGTNVTGGGILSADAELTAPPPGLGAAAGVAPSTAAQADLAAVRRDPWPRPQRGGSGRSGHPPGAGHLAADPAKRPRCRWLGRRVRCDRRAERRCYADRRKRADRICVRQCRARP